VPNNQAGSAFSAAALRISPIAAFGRWRQKQLCVKGMSRPAERHPDQGICIMSPYFAVEHVGIETIRAFGSFTERFEEYKLGPGIWVARLHARDDARYEALYIFYIWQRMWVWVEFVVEPPLLSEV
jgi:hypothetical protein